MELGRAGRRVGNVVDQRPSRRCPGLRVVDEKLPVTVPESRVQVGVVTLPHVIETGTAAAPEVRTLATGVLDPQPHHAELPRAPRPDPRHRPSPRVHRANHELELPVPDRVPAPPALGRHGGRRRGTCVGYHDLGWILEKCRQALTSAPERANHQGVDRDAAVGPAIRGLTPGPATGQGRRRGRRRCTTASATASRSARGAPRTPSSRRRTARRSSMASAAGTDRGEGRTSGRRDLDQHPRGGPSQRPELVVVEPPQGQLHPGPGHGRHQPPRPQPAGQVGVGGSQQFGPASPQHDPPTSDLCAIRARPSSAPPATQPARPRPPPPPDRSPPRPHHPHTPVVQQGQPLGLVSAARTGLRMLAQRAATVRGAAGPQPRRGSSTLSGPGPGHGGERTDPAAGGRAVHAPLPRGHRHRRLERGSRGRRTGASTRHRHVAVPSSTGTPARGAVAPRWGRPAR